MSATKPTLYIVDAVNFLFRAYYAIGPMSTPEGIATGALYGFIRSLYKLISDFSPDYFVAVFDGPDNKKSRTAIYKEYKSHRAGMPEDLFPQLESALDFCKMAGIPHLELPGVEADDTIGSIATWGAGQGLSISLCSSDKDLCQLIGPHIEVINPHKDNLRIDAAKVHELFGIYPKQMIDYLAIVGDSSDNIPGLPGFGPKTASLLLEQYGSLDNILAHAGELSGKKRETLETGAEVALLSRQLATIQCDLLIPHDLTFYQLKHPDLPAVETFYQKMHFHSLLKELHRPEKTSAMKQGAYVCVDTLEDLQALLKKWETAPAIALDTETTDLSAMSARLVGIGLTLEAHTAYYIPLNGSLPRDLVLKTCKPFLEDPCHGWIGHHLKYDMHVLANEGISLSPIQFDTLIASYLTHPHVQRHNLDELTLTHFQHTKIPIESLIGKGKKTLSMEEVPIDKVTAYCGEDVDYTWQLKQVLAKTLEAEHLDTLFTEIEIPLIAVLWRMERAGIYVDPTALKEMSHELNTETHHLEKEIYHLAGESFNINSPKQLSTLLFEKMGLKPPKRTQTGYSTSADVLESLASEAPIAQKILEYRTLEKLRSTYVDSLPEQILPSTGRIHCTFNQSVTATGRLSCQNPNLQNIPIRSPLGKKIRSAFKPEKPHGRFLSADYSQIELRILAHLSKDPTLMAAFHAGEDIHKHTAAQVFDVPLSQVTPAMRHQAKAVNFGIIYGQQAFGLARELQIPQKEAALFIEKYFARYQKIADFLAFCKESASNTGFAVTLTGRRRPLPDIHSKNGMLRTQAERMAINTPLQGTAADLIKIAMLSVDALLRQEPELGTMILQIHDELLFETSIEHVDRLSNKVKKIMETAMPLHVPLIVDVSIGKNWGEC